MKTRRLIRLMVISLFLDTPLVHASYCANFATERGSVVRVNSVEDSAGKDALTGILNGAGANTLVLDQ